MRIKMRLNGNSSASINAYDWGSYEKSRAQHFYTCNRLDTWQKTRRVAPRPTICDNEHPDNEESTIALTRIPGCSVSIRVSGSPTLRPLFAMVWYVAGSIVANDVSSRSTMSPARHVHFNDIASLLFLSFFFTPTYQYISIDILMCIARTCRAVGNFRLSSAQT